MEQSQLTKLSILGILAEEPSDKQTIRRRLQHNFSRYWTAGHGALEPAIERLRADNHIVVNPTETTDRERNMTKYELTQKGHKKLQELLQQPIPDDVLPAQHPHLMIKLGFLHHLPQPKQTKELSVLIEQFKEIRSQQANIKTQHERGVADPIKYRRELQSLTIRLIDTYIEWLEEQYQRE